MIKVESVIQVKVTINFKSKLSYDIFIKDKNNIVCVWCVQVCVCFFQDNTMYDKLKYNPTDHF